MISIASGSKIGFPTWDRLALYHEEIHLELNVLFPRAMCEFSNDTMSSISFNDSEIH
jgi:hypothetical protein